MLEQLHILNDESLSKSHLYWCQ